MIPKQIFYVWGAGEKKKRDVSVCIQTWRQVMPDYEIIEINEDSVDYFNFQENLKTSKFFRSVYNNKMWAYVADFVRIKTLYDNGGIYFDTDVSAVKTLDKFLNDNAFVGMQNEQLTEPAVLGAEKHNPILKKVLDFYEKEFWELPICTMPKIFQYILNRDYGISVFLPKDQQKVIKTNDISIYPEKVFIPFRYKSEFTHECVEADTHTIHWFGGSWLKASALDWLDNKHIDNNYILDRKKDIEDIIRFRIIGRITIIKIIKYPHQTNCWLFKNIPVFKLTENYFYLFNILPIFKIKRG